MSLVNWATAPRIIILPGASNGFPVGSTDGGEGGGIGGMYSLALKTDGTVLSWGRNDFDQLGINCSTCPTVLYSGASVRADGEVTAVAGGGHYSLALKADGTVWAWGE